LSHTLQGALCLFAQQISGILAISVELIRKLLIEVMYGVENDNEGKKEKKSYEERRKEKKLSS